MTDVVISARDATPALKEEWNDVFAKSGNAWIWHTYRMLSYVLIAGEPYHPLDCSFFICRGGTAVGIMPVVIQDDGRGGREASFYSVIGYLPSPAFCSNEAHTDQLEDFAYEELERRARKEGARRISVRYAVPPGKEDEAAVRRVAKKFDYTVMPIRTHLAAIDDSLVRKMRSRYDYKHFVSLFDLSIIEGDAVTQDIEEDYFRLHTLDAGRQVRSRQSYKAQSDFARGGEAFYVCATNKGSCERAGMALMFVSKGGAFYGSVAVDPAYKRMCVGYLLQCQAIETLRHQGITAFDLGDIHNSGISRFKEKIAQGGCRVLYQIERKW